MNVLLLIGSLQSGGAERVAVNLAQGLDDQGHKVTLLTLHSAKRDFYQVPSSIKRIPLGLEKESANLFDSIANTIFRLKQIRAAVRNALPDVVIAFLDVTNLMTILALSGTKIPVIVTEHADPTTDPQLQRIGIIRRLLYPQAQALVSVSNGVDQCFSWMPDSKRFVIHNPLPPQYLLDDHKSELNKTSKNIIVAMGRLVPEKGFDILIEAFSHIAFTYPEWDLYILGEGQCREQLEERITTNNLSNRIFLPGNLNNPFGFLHKADLFVLSSRFEGFGNVIIEAMACGLPVIASDCRSGPSEIIQHGIDGILVPPENPDLLAFAMAQLMDDSQRRLRLAENGIKKSARFELPVIVCEWEALLEQVTKLRGTQE